MSEAFDRGRDWERKVFKTVSSILKIKVKRDSRSGAGDTHKADGRDQYARVPLFIECKDQEKLNVKKDWRKAEGQASFGQAPVVVFPDNEEMLCVMRFSDVLNLIRESWDYQETNADLRSAPLINNEAEQTEKLLREVEEAKKSAGAGTCRNGHLADQWGYCQQLSCKYSRGYRPPKVKKK